MNKVSIALVLMLAYFIIDMPVNYTVTDDHNVTKVVLADTGCADNGGDDGLGGGKDGKGVPEPTLMMLLGAGIISVGVYRKFVKKREDE